MDGTVLVADDDRTIRTVLTQALTRAGCRVHATSSLTTLMRWVGEGKGDVVITDVMMPDGNGLEMLPKIANDRPELPVIVISAQNTIMTAIQAAEAQAYDYLPKPFDLPDLLKRTAKALKRRQNMSAVRPEMGDERPEDLPLVGRTPVMQQMYGVVARLLNSALPVLITGESGTGKSLIARAMHDFSDRRTLPFVVLKPEDLVEIDGPARILARAKGGTIVLDEICDFSDQAQGRIARMMDDLETTMPRFMATSQRSVHEIEASGLRHDLFYRLDGATIQVPALRERVDDIPLLANHFLDRAGQRQEQRQGQRMTEDALMLLRNYSWPGNVRQLEHLIQRLSLSAQAQEISRGDVEMALGGQPKTQAIFHTGVDGDTLTGAVESHLRHYFDMHGALLPPAGLYQRILHEIELPLLELAMEATGGNQLKCADLLGINRNTLRKKLKEHDIRVTRSRKMM